MDKNSLDLPESFVATVKNVSGEKGVLWLKELPDLLGYCQAKWQLSNLKLHPNLSFNYIVFADRQNDPSHDPAQVVLKLSPPHSQFEQETQVLKIYNGQGAFKLLDYDLEKTAMLMQAISPGISLKTFFPDKDSEAVAISVNVMKKLHTATLPNERNNFPKIEDWLKDLKIHENNAVLPKDLIQKAILLSDKLLKTQSSPVLLHGDLHHENILLNQTEWLAIDPKGVIGEPAYEVGAFIRNPFPEVLNQSNSAEIIAKRLTQFSTLLRIDKQRLAEWSFVQAVLAACWAYEDKTNWEQWINYAEIISKLI